MDCMGSLVSGYRKRNSAESRAFGIRHRDGFLQLGIELDQQHSYYLRQPASGCQLHGSGPFSRLSVFLYSTILLSNKKGLQR